MLKRFRVIWIALFGVMVMVSCVKKPGRKEVEENLKTAMEQFLNHDPRYDTSMVKFKVLEVTFYEAPKGYICDFKVNMKQKMPERLIDTVGYMNANVSKDFTAVSRRD